MMFKTLLLLPAILLGGSPALAHGGYTPSYHGPYYPSGPNLACNHFGCHFSVPMTRRQPRVRINEYCVYKPWKDKTVCKY